MREIGVPELVFEHSDIRVFADENTHYHAPLPDASKAPKSYAYRIETSQGAIVFTGDIGLSAALVSEIIDLQVTLRAVERLAPDLSAERRESLVKHLTEDLVPEQVGELAAAAAVKQVVLSAFPLQRSTSAPRYIALFRQASARSGIEGGLRVI